MNPRVDLPEGNTLNSERRRYWYAENLRYWASQPWLSGIVFAENTMVSLADLESRASLPSRMPVEFLALGGNDYPSHLGKGFGEAELLDRAFTASELVKSAELVVKVTGLQIVANLSRLLTKLPASIELAVDIREHDLLAKLGLGAAARRCDTRCFVVTRGAYFRHLAGVHRRSRDEFFYIEAGYYERTRALSSDLIRLRFPLELAFRGPAGHWGKDYGAPRERLKQLIRGLLRRAVPTLWI